MIRYKIKILHYWVIKNKAVRPFDRRQERREKTIH